MTTDLKKLADCRDALLFAEVAVWMHLLGKFSSGFLYDQLNRRGKEYKSFYKNMPPDDFKNVYDNNWVQNVWSIQSIRGVQWPQKFSQFSEKHDSPKFAEGMSSVTLCADAHGRASGTDKSVQADTTYVQQSFPIHIATVFGYESPIDEVNLDQRRDRLIRFLSKKLWQLKNDPNQIENIREEITTRLKKEFTVTVGDTRRPINDVSLWSQTASTVCFFKPALAKNILTNQWQNPTTDRCYTWRYLHIGMDGLEFFGRSNRIGDLLSRQDIFNKALDEVAKLIEVDYCVGMESYRDENGSLFLIPDGPANILKIVDTNAGCSISEKITDIVTDVLGGEATPQLKLSPKPSRNLFIAGKMLSVFVPKPSADVDSLVAWWNSSDQKIQPICSVCGLRPQGYGAKQISDYKNNPKSYQENAEDRHQCCICMDRMAGRSKKWIQDTLNKTIWIDEVTDVHGRVALIVGRFGMDHWLNGLLVSTMTVPRLDSIDQNGNVVNDLQQELASILWDQTPINDVTALPILNRFIDRHTKKGLNNIDDLYDFLVADEDLEQFPQLSKTQRLTLALLRKPPSFSRIRRVWETTRGFWQDILPTDENGKINESEGGVAIGHAGLRLAITGRLDRHPDPKKRDEKSKDTPRPYHAYTLILGGTKLSVVWDPKNQRFITAHNLEYLAEPTRLGYDVKGWFNGHKLQIEEPTGYGSQKKVWGTITIDKVDTIPDSTYTPAIPILAEPRTFMALVPADKALDVVSAINEKYEREMGKVRNRLPLHLGVVFAPYKTPLRAIMDAGRRMLKQTAPVDGWEVVKKSLYLLPSILHADPHFAAYVRLELTRGGRSAVWHVPLRMGDGKTTDEWYPYVFVKQDGDGNTPTGRKRMFEAPCPWNEKKPTWLVHAKDLRCRDVGENGNVKSGDVIYFTPATLDFQWLDTSGRRFEIAYDDKGSRLGVPRRPYLPNEFETLRKIWETLSSHLTPTQIHAFRNMIEAKREEWGVSEESRDESETFRQFCRDAIANIEWKKCNGKYPWEKDGDISKQGWLDIWKDYAVRGWLNDAIELYIPLFGDVPTHHPNGVTVA